MRKHILVFMILGLFLFVMAGLAQAALTTIGTATYLDSDYNLIWDDDNNGNSVVWLDYTNLKASWTNQKYWVDVYLPALLTINIDPAYSVEWEGDWRLPDAGVDPQNAFYQTSSEMGHLYYEELGLESYPNRYSVSVTAAELNASEFNELRAAYYWSGTESSTSSHYAWLFITEYGLLESSFKTTDYNGLAVRNADVSAVPIPGAVWLLGSGLIGLAGIRRRKK